jgi:hypothetical protein
MSDSRPVLSHSQFAQSYGASREYATGKQGKRGGYYVSRDPGVPVQKGGGVEEVSPTSFDAAAAERHWHETRGIALATTPEKDREKVHQGIWYDDKTGKTHVDISDRVTSGLPTALKKGISQGQLAIYSAGAGKSLPTNIETPSGFRQPAEGAEMVAESYGKKEKQWKERSKMSRKKKESLLSEMDRDVAAIKKARGE